MLDLLLSLSISSKSNIRERRRPDLFLPNPASRSGAGLIRQVCEQFGQTVDGDPATAETAAQEPVRCADGYVRRSPVQPYGTAEDYTRRRTRRIVMIALAAVFAVLLIYALMRSGLLVFRLR